MIQVEGEPGGRRVPTPREFDGPNTPLSSVFLVDDHGLGHSPYRTSGVRVITADDEDDVSPVAEDGTVPSEVQGGRVEKWSGGSKGTRKFGDIDPSYTYP